MKQRDLMAYGSIGRRRSALLGTTDTWRSHDFDGRAYLPPTRYHKGHVDQTTTDFNYDIRLPFHDLNLFPLFARMQQMEQQFGVPQYFEWALTLDGENPKYWIVQVADVNKKADFFDFEDFGEPFIEGSTVTGTNIIDCDTVVYCRDDDQVERLKEFNKNNKGYLLLYSADMTSGGRNVARHHHGTRQLEYSDVNNAAVLIEIQNAQHNQDPLAHFQGQLDMTGKLFAAVDLPHFSEFEFWDKWDDFWEKAGTDTGFRVLQKKMKVVGSERQNRLALYPQD